MVRKNIKNCVLVYALNMGDAVESFRLVPKVPNSFRGCIIHEI